MTRLDFAPKAFGVGVWNFGELAPSLAAGLVIWDLVFVFVLVEVAMSDRGDKYLGDYREYDERNQGERKSYIAYI